MRPSAAFQCGWNRRPIHWTSEKLSAHSDVIYTVSHGLFAYHVRANVHAGAADRLHQFRFASHHFEFLVDMKAFPDAVAAYVPTLLNQNDHPLVPTCSDWLRVKVNRCPAHLFTGRFNQYARVLA